MPFLVYDCVFDKASWLISQVTSCKNAMAAAVPLSTTLGRRY